MRTLLPVLLLVACSTPVEDCRILRPVSADEGRRLHGNFVILSATAECASGFCMQDTPDASVGNVGAAELADRHRPHPDLPVTTG